MKGSKFSVFKKYSHLVTCFCDAHCCVMAIMPTLSGLQTVTIKSQELYDLFQKKFLHNTSTVVEKQILNV